jgi:alpha-ribazole phosphatase
MAGAVILVRHPPVTRDWQKRCYGQSDPGLSREGQAMIAPLVDQIAALKTDVIIHSDMKRTRAIALPLAERLGIVAIAQPLWRERDFGTWEGRSWHSIYRETGNAMDGMIDAPDHFRPGGGETTGELAKRIGKALAALPEARSVAIITHGGPISCARMMRAGALFQQLATLIPQAGSLVML